MLTGTILHVDPKRLIVQSWRSANWPTDTIDSVLVLSFWPEGQGGRADLLGIVVPVIFKGPWDDLSIRPDLAGLFKPGGGGELIEGAKGIVEGGGGGIKDLLKGLGGTEAAPARKPNQPGAKSQPLFDPTKQLKKLFD